MHNRLYHTLIIIICLLAASCSNSEMVESQQVGFMRFAFSSVPADSTITLTVSSADGVYSHTWPDATLFSPTELFFVGSYKAEAYAGTPGSEGFDCPSYYGSASFDVKHLQQTEVDIDCNLMQAMVSATFTQETGAPYRLNGATIHTSGHAYITVTPAEKRTAYVMPGETEIYVSLTDAEGRTINMHTGLTVKTLSAQSYKVEVNEGSDGILTVNCGQESRVIEIGPEMFSSASPVVSPIGFTPGETLRVTEGYPAPEQIAMHVEATSPLAALRLTVNGFDTQATDYHVDIDLISEAENLKGLKLDMPDASTADIDFTSMLETYQIDKSVNVTFTLQAIDKLGRMSDPLELDVAIESVDFTLVYKSGAEIGVDTATIRLLLNVSKAEPGDFKIYTDTGTQLDINTSEWDAATRELTINFNVPPGTNPVPVIIYFLDVAKLKLDIERTSPDFEFSIDAFAKRARITISGATQEIIEMVTRHAHITVNDADVAVTKRDPASGLLEISGLEPSTRYNLSLWVIDHEYTAAKQFVTESAPQVPSGDFEEVTEKYKYKRLPSGGEYSATRFAIFNQQNFTDISVYWPNKHWASINDKTFCTGATNHNTWYMQPSAAIDFTQSASGSKSIMLKSVGWSANGEEIPPSVQPNYGFVPYNTNQPATTNVSAGRAFLGSYSFNLAAMTETYREGQPFGSRPSSLDGFFKYLPDVTQVGDNGKIIVEFVNDTASPEILVASGEFLFTTAPDFRSFNIPINYYVYHMPVTRLRIMIMSSVPTESGPSGDQGVPVTADLKTATFEGSTLWIDNLSFSY